MRPGYGTVLDAQGDILGIIEYRPGMDITEVVTQILRDNGKEFQEVKFEQTIVSSGTDFTGIDGQMITEENEEIFFELSFTPTIMYKAPVPAAA